MDVEEFRRCLGDNLKYLRKKRNLTQSALAEVIGLETHNLNRIENGKSFPQAKTILCTLFATQTASTTLWGAYFPRRARTNGG